MTEVCIDDGSRFERRREDGTLEPLTVDEIVAGAFYGMGGIVAQTHRAPRDRSTTTALQVSICNRHSSCVVPSVGPGPTRRLHN